VWEFEDEETRETAEGTIQAGGYIIGLAAIDWMDEPHFWSAGRVIALVVGDDGNTFDLLDRILGDELDTQEEGGESSGLLMSQLMNQFGLSADQIEIVSAEQTTWPDGCLGMAKSGEMCTQAMVPGWKVMARLDGTLYEIRTDELFNRLRYRVSQ
jgi:hypothetical protein